VPVVVHVTVSPRVSASATSDGLSAFLLGVGLGMVAALALLSESQDEANRRH
jgi:hypothetical protein